MPALTPLLLLGKTVTLNTWGCCLTPEQEAWVLARFRQAFALIDAERARLSPEIASAIGTVASIVVPASNAENLGASGTNGMTLSLPYIQLWSVQWLASLMGHEGQHHRNHGEFSGADLWRDEQSACITQLALGNLVWMPAIEQAYLQKWMSDSNAAQLEIHMNGYAGP